MGVDAYKNDAAFRGGDLLCKLAEQHKSLVSLTISDSLVTHDGMQSIAKGLNHSHSFLKELSLKFCFLHKEQLRQLMQAMTTNQSIVFLDLKHNAIDNAAGHYLSQMLLHNFTLHALNLQNNCLGDHFIDSLCPALRKNNVLSILKLGFNAIGTHGAKLLLDLLGADNDSIDDFGDIGNNPMGIGFGEQINTKVRKNMQMNGRQLEDSSSYKVTKPVDFMH